MNCSAFLPELIVLATGMALLGATLVRDLRPSTVRLWMLGGSALVVGASFWSLQSSGSLFMDTYRVDLLSQGFKTLVALGFFFTVFLSEEPGSIPASRTIEYYLFLSTGTLGMMMLASAADLLVLYISMELSSYSLYLLTALRKDRKNAEAGVKYLIFGAATSGVFLWGLSFVLGLAGTASLTLIASNAGALAAQPAFLLGLAFMLFAFLFKLSAFPFHFWAPDVYESASTPVTNFIATASKAAAVAVLVRVLVWTGVPEPLVTLLGILGFLSMTLGNTAALLQQDVKRLLAYSSVAQAGYIVIGLLSGTPEGFGASFLYATAYLIMNTAVFVVVSAVARDARHDNPMLAF
jgi:F420H2 dehydrogenase subunit N